jgi:hypothetical protein
MVMPPAVAVLLVLGLLLGLALTLGLGLLPEVLVVSAGLTEALVVPVTAGPAAGVVDGLRVSSSAATMATTTTAATPLRAAIRPLDHRDDRTGGVIPVGVY